MLREWDTKHNELIDLVGADGSPRVRSITRGEVQTRLSEFLERGLYQPIVVVVLVDANGRVTAQVRGPSKGTDGRDEVDHVCGVIGSGETWQEAAVREAAEEIGVSLSGLQLVGQGVNAYRRYRVLATARPVGRPVARDPNEVSSVFQASSEELRRMAATGDKTFVKGFFDDLHQTLSYLAN